MRLIWMICFLPFILVSFILFSTSVLIADNLNSVKKYSVDFSWNQYSRICSRVFHLETYDFVKIELSDDPKVKKFKDEILSDNKKYKEIIDPFL